MTGVLKQTMSLIKQLSSLGLAASLSVGLVACGGSDGDDGNFIQPDIDEAGTHNTFVVNGIEVPASGKEASAIGLDLNADGIVDNALGGLLGAIATIAPGLDLQAGVDDQLASGSFILLNSVKATDLSNANGVGSFFFFGENPQPAACTDPLDIGTCGKHLAGTGAFDITAASPKDAVIVGTLTNGVLKAGPGSVAIELAIDENTTLDLDLIGARLEATVSADGVMSGRLAGAITKEDVDSKIIPAITDLITSLIEADCTDPEPPSCNCEDNSSGGVILTTFDTDKSCDVSLEEFKANSLIDATLRKPDLDLLDADGNFNPGQDDLKDSLSLGVGLTAVKGTFTVPAGL